MSGERWMWCLHCQRVWPYRGQLPRRCKTPACDGGFADICDYHDNGWSHGGTSTGYWSAEVTPGQLVPLYPKQES
jgi:hypothetical protein